MTEIDAEIFNAFLDDADDALSQWEKACLQWSPENTAEPLKILLRCTHNLKGSCPIFGLTRMKDELHAIEDVLIMVREGQRAMNEEMVKLLLELEGYFNQWAKALRNNYSYSPAETDLFAKLKGLESAAHPAPAVATQEARPVFAKRRAGAPVRFDETIRVSAAKIDHLIQMVGEIALYQSMVVRAYSEFENRSTRINSAITFMGKLTRDLQNLSLSLRMVPLHSLFQKLERTAREVAIEEKKPIKIEKIGEDVSLDKIIIEKVTEPLIHILRNAVDHGIETPEGRKHKPREATILIAATNEAGGVTLRVSDDGKGIDSEKAYFKALEKKLIAPEANLTAEEKMDLIFLPGLSTAEKITDISGRGVGLDVVRDTVVKLGGSVSVNTQPGQGTTFIINLPTNLSIIDALIVRVDECQYAVPNQDLAEVIDLCNYKIETSGINKRMINLRGQAIPVESMRKFLTTKAQADSKTQESGPGLIVETVGKKVIFSVDGIVGQQQIFVRPLNDHLAKIPGISGATILNNGEPSMLINMLDLTKAYFTEAVPSEVNHG